MHTGISTEALLKFACENNILDISVVRLSLSERLVMEKHNEKIWQGKNGRWYTYIPAENKQKRRLIAKSSKESLIQELSNVYFATPTVEQIFTEWVDKKLEYGEIYKQTYDRYVNDFKRFFEDIKGKQIGEINSLWLEDFIKKTIKDKQLSAKQWANMRLLVNGIFKLSKKKGYTDFSISEFMSEIDIGRKNFRQNKKIPPLQVLNSHETDLIFEWIDKHPSLQNLGILLVFHTGLRAGELSALKRSDIDGNIIHLHRTEIRYKDESGHYIRDFRESTKGAIGFRDVVLTQDARQIVDKILELSNTEFVFEGISGLNFTQTFERICDNVQIPKRSLHKIRKTYCTNLLNANVPESVIKAQVGHVDISTTKQFYYFDNLSVQDKKNILETV